MGKSTSFDAATEQQFAKLQKVLSHTTTDTLQCLKALKSNLSDYDSRHSHHVKNKAKGFMRGDLRKAKDSAKELQHVAHSIHRHKPSEKEITLARSAMQSTADAMAFLKVTARKYDEKQGEATGLSNLVDNALGNKDDKKKDAKSGGLFGRSDKHDKHGKHAKTGGLFEGGKHKKNDKQKDSPLEGLIGRADTVEAVVARTLNENFNGFSPLQHQISAAKRSASPSIIDRAKDKVHDVKDKLKGGSTSPRRVGSHHAHH